MWNTEEKCVTRFPAGIFLWNFCLNLIGKIPAQDWKKKFNRISKHMWSFNYQSLKEHLSIDNFCLNNWWSCNFIIKSLNACKKFQIQYLATILNNLSGNKYMKVMSLKLLLINISGYLNFFIHNKRQKKCKIKYIF